jgi:hypothetical protein
MLLTEHIDCEEKRKEGGKISSERGKNKNKNIESGGCQINSEETRMFVKKGVSHEGLVSFNRFWRMMMMKERCIFPLVLIRWSVVSVGLIGWTESASS